MTGKVIAFANQKGGVGKTTSCVNLAASLNAAKSRVLLIDLDPQGNATMGCGVNKNKLSATVNDVLLQTEKVSAAIVKKTPGGFDILPANSNLTAAEVSLVGKRSRERKLAEALTEIKKNYDFLLIDCPPSLNMLTLNALVAADSLIIPMQCEYYALEGLSALLETMRQVKKKLNPKLKIEGILRTMYDPRNKLSEDVSSQLKQHFPKEIYKTIIPRNIRLAEAPSHGVPILLYDGDSRGASAYLALAREVLRATSGSSKKKSTKKSASLEVVYGD